MKKFILIMCSIFILLASSLSAQSTVDETSAYFIIHTTTDDFAENSTCHILLVDNDESVEMLGVKKYKLLSHSRYNREQILSIYDAIIVDKQVRLVGIYNLPETLSPEPENNGRENNSQEKPDDVNSEMEETSNKLLFYNPNGHYMHAGIVRFFSTVSKEEAVGILGGVMAKSRKLFDDGLLSCYPFVFGKRLTGQGETPVEQDLGATLKKLAEHPKVIYVIPKQHGFIKDRIYVEFKALSVKNKLDLKKIDEICQKVNAVAISSMYDTNITIRIDTSKTELKNAIGFLNNLVEVKYAEEIKPSNIVPKPDRN